MKGKHRQSIPVANISQGNREADLNSVRQKAIVRQSLCEKTGIIGRLRGKPVQYRIVAFDDVLVAVSGRSGLF
jgi:hypothetical protein